MLKISFVLTALALMGCVPTQTPEQRQAKLSAYAAQCQVDYGVKPGTPIMSQCIMTLEQREVEQATARRQAVGAALSGYGNGMARAYRPPVTCRSNYNPYGSTTTCQ